MQGNGEGLGIGVTIVVVVVIAVFLILIAGAVILIMKPDLLNKMNKNKNLGSDGDESSSETTGTVKVSKIGDTKEFIPYERLLDYCLDLGNYNYRAIIEVSSLNYDLMSYTEQQMIDATYKAFLDSLDFPIEIYIQTREFDTQAVLDDLEERSKAAVRKYRNLTDYATRYMEEMAGITERFGNSKTKKKYVIVSFSQDDLQDVSELTKYEINAFAQEELMQRCAIVVSGLESVGLTAVLLDRIGIAEVLYSYYHRDNFRIAEDIVNGNLTTLVIDGPKSRKDQRYTLDRILTSTQNSLKALVTASSTDEELKLYKYIFNEIEKFKQDDRAFDMAHLFYNTAAAAEKEGYLDDYYKYCRLHPEAEFWNLPPHDYNNGRVSMPEGIVNDVSDIEVAAFRNEQSLGRARVSTGPVGEFDPSSYSNGRR